MKLLLLSASLLCLGLAGCDSAGDFSTGLSHVANRGEPKTRDFKAEPGPTYDAAKAALAAIDYHFVHGGRAEGKLQGRGDIMQGDTPGSSRQVMVKVTFEPTLDGGTTVGVLFTEDIEADSSNQPGMATETPLYDTPLYEIFFRAIQAKLTAPPTS